MAGIELKAEVTGAIWKVEKQEGETVAAGDVVLIIESMKMEIPVVTEDAGIVHNVRVKPGDAVNEGDVVAIIEG